MPQIKTDENGNIIISVMMCLRKYSGRKRIITPDDQGFTERTNDAILTAIARAFHWKTLIEKGEVRTAEDIALRVNTDPSYVRRILRLNYLSPQIIRRIINGDVPQNLSLAKLTQKQPDRWDEQEKMLLF